MSSSLYWRPAPKKVPAAQSLPYGLKSVIARRLWDHDGSLNGDPVEVDHAFLPYLRGVADAGNGDVAEGARELIGLIEEHGEVELWIE
jgi:hypothetical protein